MNEAAFSVEVQGDWLAGPWRTPCNNARHEAGTIHDDATAQAHGYRSGTVAGSIHMEQFAPLLLHALGPGWLERGALSLWFRAPSVDSEPVRALVQAQGTQRRVRMLTAQGLEVLEGSASATLDSHGAVRQHLAQSLPGAAPRMLAQVPVGWAVHGLPTRVAQAAIERRRHLLTEAVGDGVPLSAAVHAMRVYEPLLPLQLGAAVGLFGAIEWQWLAGPMKAEHNYLVDARVLDVGDSPRSEMLWCETTLRDAALGHAVARMLMLSRLLKASSPLWTETPAS